MVNKFMERGTNKENMWKHGNIWQLWKGTSEHGTSWETLRYAKHGLPWFHSRVWPDAVLGSAKLARQVHQRSGRASQLGFDPLAIDNILSITEQKSCFLVSLTSSSSSRHRNKYGRMWRRYAIFISVTRGRRWRQRHRKTRFSFGFISL